MAAAARQALADNPSVIDGSFPDGASSWSRTFQVLATWLALWIAPFVVIGAMLGFGTVYTAIGLFFSKMAVVTFGGAYAVLAYVAQQAVETYHWLKPGEMLDGLALAETTPGPLVLVLSFVGFMAAFRAPLGLDPLVSGLLGATLATWVTFVPCFLWIFLGAPYVETLRNNRARCRERLRRSRRRSPVLFSILPSGLACMFCFPPWTVLRLALFPCRFQSGKPFSCRLSAWRFWQPRCCFSSSAGS